MPESDWSQFIPSLIAGLLVVLLGGGMAAYLKSDRFKKWFIRLINTMGLISKWLIARWYLVVLHSLIVLAAIIFRAYEDWRILAFSLVCYAAGALVWGLPFGRPTSFAMGQSTRSKLPHLEDRETTGPVSGKVIMYGSVIKLIHDVTGYSLHSHNRNYKHIGTSGQQQVTANFSSDDSDFWIVKGQHNSPETYRSGQSIRHGDIVRLEHKATRTNLHSHIFPSPVSSQQEITAFGKDGTGDTNDNWKVDIQGAGDWLEGTAIRLIHVNTGVALHSHDAVLPEWGLNQQEVTGYSARDQNDLWKAAIYS